MGFPPPLHPNHSLSTTTSPYVKWDGPGSERQESHLLSHMGVLTLMSAWKERSTESGHRLWNWMWGTMGGIRGFKRGERAKVIWDKWKVSYWRRERGGERRGGKESAKVKNFCLEIAPMRPSSLKTNRNFAWAMHNLVGQILSLGRGVSATDCIFPHPHTF